MSYKPSQHNNQAQYWNSYSTETRESDNTLIPRVASGLGWLSLGLGIAQVGWPSTLTRLIGVGDDDRNRTLMQVVGLREIVAGMGILSSERPVRWLWARVAGDIMDLALLSAALKSDDSENDKAVRAAMTVAGITAIDVVTVEQFSSQPGLMM